MRQSCGSIVAVEPLCGTSEVRDDPVGIDTPNSVVVRLAEVDIALVIDCYRSRISNDRGGGRTTISRQAGRSVARYGGDDAICVDTANAMSRILRYVHHSGCLERASDRFVDGSHVGRSVVPE